MAPGETAARGKVGRWARRQVARAAGWPLAWRTMRRVIEGDWKATSAVIRRFNSGPERWLDVGCGEAPLAELFSPGQYLGIDHAPARLDRARARCPDHRFARADARTWRGDGAPFDRLLMVHLLHHLADDEVREVTRAMRALLRPGGKVLVIDPVPAWQARGLLHRHLLPLETGAHHRAMERAEALLGIRPEHRGQDAGSRLYDSYWFFGRFTQ